ncbi:MAG: HD domain-containing phosphohydrolase [Bacillota bacterium]|nr:HD domain-containing phosphohydrolase [Bacillota bacterium]
MGYDNTTLITFLERYAFTIINFLLVLSLITVILLAIRLVIFYLEKNRIETEITKDSVKKIINEKDYKINIYNKSGEILPDEEREEVFQEYILDGIYTLNKKSSKKIEKELSKYQRNIDSKRDKLTELFGRDKLKIEFKDTGSFIYFNLNGLRKINKEEGYKEGDNQILTFTQVVQDILPKKANMYRINGDEFAVDLPEFSKNESEKLIILMAEKLSGNENFKIDVAVGITFKEELEDRRIDSVIMKAEENMHKNKLTAKTSIRSQLIYTLLDVLGEKSFETEEHAVRLKDYALAIGENMGLARDLLNELILLSYLHDIGKVSIPDSILTKPTKLKEEEWKVMKTHTKMGSDLIKKIPDLESISHGILYHHENWDGTGYPEGLSGKNIPLVARIIRIVDSYDAMTNTRTYNLVKSKEEAVEEIKKYSGILYDPEIVEVFIEVSKNYVVDDFKEDKGKIIKFG